MTTPPLFEQQKDAQPNDVAEVLAALQCVGRTRLDQEVRGGAVFADFADFCWRAHRHLSVDLFDLWLSELSDEENPEEAQVAQARIAIEAGL